MKHMVVRYARLYGVIVRISWARFMAFRESAPLSLLHAAMYAGTTVIFFGVIFGQVSSLGDWNRDQVFVFIGTSYLIDFLWMLLWFHGLMGIPGLIRSGDMDLLMCKPANTLFLASTRSMDLNQWSGLLLGGGLVAWSVHDLGGHPGFVAIGLYVLLLLVGVGMFYGITVIVTSLAFLTPQLQLINEAMEWFYQFAMRPDAIYQGQLRVVLTYIIPAIVMMNYPARILTNRLTLGQTVWGVAVGVAVIGMSLWFWSRAERWYTSASS